MSYVARAKPLTRHVALPAASASIPKMAAMLAGNLARDEAAELTAEMEARPPPAPRRDGETTGPTLTQAPRVRVGVGLAPGGGSLGLSGAF